MYSLLILFISICLVGLAFWYYNRRQMRNLGQIIEDKQAVINALRSTFEQPMFSESDTIEFPNPVQRKPRTPKKKPASIAAKRSSKKKS